MKNIKEELDRIRPRLSEPGFLANKGLGNEVGIHIFCYDAKDELTVQNYIQLLSSDSTTPFRIVERNLYILLLKVLEEKRILNAVTDMEVKKGTEFIQQQLQKKSYADALLSKINYTPHEQGDVLFLTGIGQIYPLIRVHNMLDSMQCLFEDVPIVVFYPGNFNGKELELFGQLFDGNYYRAFNLL